MSIDGRSLNWLQRSPREHRDTRVLPRDGHLWTSAEAAKAFRVGVSSIKRWTDEGELESVRTPGGHRRYTLAALHRFARIRQLPVDQLPSVEEIDVRIELPVAADVTLFEALVNGNIDAVRRLVTPRIDGLASRAAFLDRVVGDALREIGWRWERGKLGIDEEHRASYTVIDAVDRLRPAARADGKLALLACPPGELHDLPLRLVRLVFEWGGWRTDFLGAATPWESLRNTIERTQPEVLALSSRDGDCFRDDGFTELVRWCKEQGTQVLVGGEWARGGTGDVDGYLRFRTLRGFERWMRSI
ncbi:MAG TPA: cobalamin B12-binding domain-containing protein [Thermoanaerobaculia bacterium]|jgi:excisionase family DNA binding protein